MHARRVRSLFAERAHSPHGLRVVACRGVFRAQDAAQRPRNVVSVVYCAPSKRRPRSVNVSDSSDATECKQQAVLDDPYLCGLVGSSSYSAKPRTSGSTPSSSPDNSQVGPQLLRLRFISRATSYARARYYIRRCFSVAAIYRLASVYTWLPLCRWQWI